MRLHDFKRLCNVNAALDCMGPKEMCSLMKKKATTGLMPVGR